MGSSNTTFEGIFSKSVADEGRDQDTSDPGANEKGYFDVEIGETSRTLSETTSVESPHIKPTPEEYLQLRKVPGKIPSTAWLLCVVELAERASYYGSSILYSNFMQFPLPKGGNGAGAPPRGAQKTAGALGKGLQFANALVLTVRLVGAVAPVITAWVVDVHMGRFRGIIIGIAICGVAHLLQVLGALPAVLQSGHGLGPFLSSAFLLAIGAGVIRPCILPTTLDQYSNQVPYVTRLKSGEKVIVDPETTINHLTLYFHASANVGALFPIATVYAEKLMGFWLAFLLPGAVNLALPFLLMALRKRITKLPPHGSEISAFFTIMVTAFRRRQGRFWTKGFLESAKPSVMRMEGYITFQGKPIPWDDKLVDDVRRTLTACTMFLYFPIMYMSLGGIGSIATSQASTLRTNGVPNDLLYNFNPITVMTMVPLLAHVIYPTLRHFNMMPGRITRITFGFVLAALSSTVGCIVQFYIYRTSPCRQHATNCQVGTRVSPISVWVQAPIFVVGAMSECFSQVTAYEIAYARSPKSMKAIVMSIFILMSAISSALGTTLTPLVRDPYLPYVWAGPVVAMLILAAHFYWRYRWMNNDDFMTHGNEMLVTRKSVEE